MLRISLYVAILLLGAASVYIYQSRNTEPIYHTQSYIFGTLVDITIYGETDAHAMDVSAQILQDFQHLHNQLHAWKAPASHVDDIHHAGELMAINAAFSAGQTATNLSNAMIAILQDVKRLSLQSQHLFNPAIGHLIQTWGFQRDTYSAVKVKKAVITQWRDASPSMADIVVDAAANSAFTHNPAVKLDLGGYAKGYALDIAIQTLKKAHVKHALINIGGNIIALGQHGEKPWRVGIQHPRQPNAIATVALPSGWAIGTSGDYQRFFMLNGTRYCHIIDPRIGYPVQHTQAVTVLVPPQPANVSQAGVLSDVASKPIFIADHIDKTKLAKAMHISNFMTINAQGQVFVSPSFAEKLTWLNPDETFRLIE
jgi:FAD:protein FMN transferase